MRLAVLLLTVLASSATAESAHAVLHVRPGDRTIAIRAPKARAVLSVVPGDAAASTPREVVADEAGYWHLEALALGAAGVLSSGGAVLYSWEADSSSATTAFPALIEAGSATIEVPVAGGAHLDPSGCTLRLENDEASIRQDLPGADVFISGEGPDSRALFNAWIAPDQVGPTTAILTTSASRASWPTRIWRWRWTSSRSHVTSGEPATFRLEVDGLPAGAECDITLEAPPSLTLVSAPGPFSSAGAGRWNARVQPGDFTFETTGDGRAEVAADVTPCSPR